MDRVKKKWAYKAVRAPFHELGEQFHISDITARLIVNRGALSCGEMESYLHAGTDQLHDPRLMKDMDEGTEIMAEKIRKKKKIRIIGDYDVDGITSTYILYQGLSLCGACPDYEIPHRIRDGYGINQQMIERAGRDGIDTIITCDNGISAAGAIERGRELGLTIIVTDHHELPPADEDGGHSNLPRAQALIDPMQNDCSYPEKTICGAVVAWKFVQLLCEKMGAGKRRAEDLLQMAALGTVCDVMPLTGENRIIVREGLNRIRHTDNKGLLALMEVLGLDRLKITAQDLAFTIGPALNATGRLDSAGLALDLLLCDDYSTCLKMSAQIKRMNEERKLLTRQGEAEALSILKKTGREEDRFLLVFLPDCHESICGIVAGRLCDLYHRPAIVLTRAQNCLKGSGRSPEGYDLYQAVSKAGHLLDRFGGHESAAGLSLQEKNLEELRHLLNTGSEFAEVDLTEKILIDMELPFSFLSEDLIEEFNLLEPCGVQNEKPLFGQKFLMIEKLMLLGQKKNLIKLHLKTDKNDRITAIYYQDVDQFLADIEDHCGPEAIKAAMEGRSNPIRITIAYTPQINEWMGNRNIELNISKYHIH